jgi:hypothetical protein
LDEVDRKDSEEGVETAKNQMEKEATEKKE